MRIGFCAPWEQAAVVARAGFDYIEPSVAWGLKPEQAWADSAFSGILDVTIKAEAFNGFLPGDLKIVGQEIDETRLQTYLEAAFDRLAKVGAERVVFGSAGSRRVPEGFSRDKARTQIIDFLNRCAPLAEAHGLLVAIEPLGSAECNIINSVDEAMEYVQAVDRPSIRVLADLYHIDSDAQSHLETRNAGQALRHVHVAGRVDRRVPIEGDIDYLAAYFRILGEAGYDDRISVEASVVDIAREAPVAAHVLRKAWALAASG
jgi:sugar phosphate isomerase/epimerase